MGVELGHVTGLYISNNHLTGSIPPELGNLVSLRIAELEMNRLTGSIPQELGNLTKSRISRPQRKSTEWRYPI